MFAVRDGLQVVCIISMRWFVWLPIESNTCCVLRSCVACNFVNNNLMLIEEKGEREREIGRSIEGGGEGVERERGRRGERERERGRRGERERENKKKKT